MRCSGSTTYSSLNYVETWAPAQAWPQPLGNLGEVCLSFLHLSLLVYKMAGFLRSLLALDFFVVGMAEEGRSKVWDGICEGELWRCVHDEEVVSISVFMVCVQQGHFCSQRGPSREFLGCYKRELPSRASSDPIPVSRPGP